MLMQWRYLSSGKLMDLQEVLSDDEDEMEAETAAGKTSAYVSIR